MQLIHLVKLSQETAATRSRKKKVALMAPFLKQLTPAEVEIAASWLMGELRQGKIGLGYSAVRAVREQPAASEPALQLQQVSSFFDRIAEINGPGSAGARLQLLQELFALATASEQEFLQRLIVGELRQGALEGVLQEAVAGAASVSLNSVRRALMLSGDIRKVAVAALKNGESGLAGFRLELLHPLQPMLAQSAEAVEQVFERFRPPLLEYKLDGARIQVHRQGDEVRIFTRNLNNVTAALPEIVKMVQNLPVTRLILDGEALVMREGGAPAPFQVTMSRFGRKSPDSELQNQLPLTPFFFDVLHAGGEDLIDRPLQERKDLLQKIIPAEFQIPSVFAGTAEKTAAFLKQSLLSGHEGMMAKSAESLYEAGRRGNQWLKIKPVYTLDLVILAAEWGSGRRKGFLSNLHLGARNPADNSFVMLGKTFKGLTDQMLAWQTQKLLELAIAREGHIVHVRPELVVEVAFDGIQASSQYPGGMALRFARVKRYRPDKSAEQADQIENVRAIFEGNANPHLFI
ncbi:MAG: ATP-dependent DNA ligase [Calditrichia bacterium]